MTSTLKEKMTASLEAAKAIAAKAETERRDLTEDEVGQAATYLKAYEEHKKEFQRQQKLSQDSAEFKSMLEQIGNELNLERNDPDHRVDPHGFMTLGKGQTLGSAFVKSAEYKTLMQGAHGGRFNEKQRIESGPMVVKSLVYSGGEGAPAGAFVQPMRDSLIEMLGRPTLSLRDLVSVRQTESDAVEYVRQTVQPTAAAPVAEAKSSAAPTTNAEGATVLAADGGYKPEGSIAFEVVKTSVKTIAEWIAATKRSIADAAQLRGLIDQELKADLLVAEEREMLTGDGTGEHFTGILNTPGIQTQARSATVSGVDPLLETTLKAKTKARIGGRTAPTAYLLNPQDFEAVQLARIAKNPANEAIAGAVPTLHGLPVVESEGIPAGTGLVGDFSRAVLWDREQASVSITDSHADFFIRNLVAILAEERAAFGVTRPAAFVKMSFTA